MKQMLIDPIIEAIESIDELALIQNADLFLDKKIRLVRLMCGHRIVTKALHRAACPRCREMLRRSCMTGEEDYLSFRAGRKNDRMSWKEDPFRKFNEPVDLAGDLKYD